MPVRAGIPFIAIATCLVTMQHGPEGRSFGPRFVFTLHSGPSVSLCYQVPSVAAENRKEEAQNVLRQLGTSQTSKRSLLQLQQLPFFLLTPWEPVRACFQLQRTTVLASFRLNCLPPLKVCVLTAWSSVAGPIKCFREWGWRKQDPGDVLFLILSCSTLPIPMPERNFLTPPHSPYPTMVLGPASGPEASESSDHGLKP